MARRKKHEEHANHEAWAIPYGDLITLLLAFFVVMYAISSVNEGKFRVLSDSLSVAFKGDAKALEPIQLGEKVQIKNSNTTPIPQKTALEDPPRQLMESLQSPIDHPPNPMTQQLSQVADELETALKDLVDANLVSVRRHEFWLEVEVRTDILFASGVATLSDTAYPALDALAGTLSKHANPLRVEGHTDNRPIITKLFPSNWELSAARAASVVHRFQDKGVAPTRLSVIGFGEYRPAQPNTTAAGRNANRRVIIVILSGDGSAGSVDSASQANQASEASQANQPTALPPFAGGNSLPSTTNNSGSSNTAAPAAAPQGTVGTETAPLPLTVGTGGGNPSRE